MEPLPRPDEKLSQTARCEERPGKPGLETGMTGDFVLIHPVNLELKNGGMGGPFNLTCRWAGAGRGSSFQALLLGLNGGRETGRPCDSTNPTKLLLKS